MKGCCSNEDEIQLMKQSHGRVLWIVLAINASMFLVELVVGVLSQSTALMADSLDMLGDALVYSFSLFVLGKGIKWEAKASVLKGVIMLSFGIGVLAEAVYKILNPVVPEAGSMGITGAAALVMNSICFYLLWKHRGDNLNMQSTWVCSRNDLIGNVGVIIASGLTAVTASKWPDIAIGLSIAAMFVNSAIQVLREAKSALAQNSKSTVCNEVVSVDPQPKA